MKICFLLSLFLFSCSGIQLRSVDLKNNQSKIFHSKENQATLEVLFSASEKSDINNAVLKARITNNAKEDLKIDLKKSYHWSAWYRWQRRPRTTSETPLIIHPGETKDVSWTFMRREFGVMLIPFAVGEKEDEFKLKFEYCSPWESC